MTYEKTLEHHSVDRYVTDSVHSIRYNSYYYKLFGIDCALVFSIRDVLEGLACCVVIKMQARTDMLCSDSYLHTYSED